MNDAKAVAFLQELLVKTREGKIRWRPTAIEETYVSAFGGKFGLTISDKAYLSAESWGRTPVAETAGKLMQGFVLRSVM